MTDTTGLIELQRELAAKVRLEDDFGEIRTIAGIDVSIGRGWTHGRCGIVVLSYPEMEILETCVHEAPISFPYIPGLLGFREVPIFLETREMLSIDPDIIVFDGQGYAHPRRCGLACHAGALLDKPAIGCAKSRLTGTHDGPVDESGAISCLYNDDEQIGDVIRTKKGSKPIFVSPGHRISFATATRIMLECTRGYRIPEPTRLAHNLVSVSARL